MTEKVIVENKDGLLMIFKAEQVALSITSPPPNVTFDIIKEVTTTSMSYRKGDQVVKRGGDYVFSGTVECAFRKVKGAPRYVVRNQDGIEHIASETGLRPAEIPHVKPPEIDPSLSRLQERINEQLKVMLVEPVIMGDPEYDQDHGEPYQEPIPAQRPASNYEDGPGIPLLTSVDATRADPWPLIQEILSKLGGVLQIDTDNPDFYRIRRLSKEHRQKLEDRIEEFPLPTWN